MEAYSSVHRYYRSRLPIPRHVGNKLLIAAYSTSLHSDVYNDSIKHRTVSSRVVPVSASRPAPAFLLLHSGPGFVRGAAVRCPISTPVCKICRFSSNIGQRFIHRARKTAVFHRFHRDFSFRFIQGAVFPHDSAANQIFSSDSAMAPKKSKNELEIVQGDGELQSEIVHNMPSLKKPYRAYPIVCCNRHVETIFASYYRSRPPIRFRRECLRMIDGGTVTLDWPVVCEDDNDQQIWKEQIPSDAPVVILLPGLTGGSHDSYVRHMVLRVRKHGWRPVVFNSRGCSDSPVTSPKFYSASFTEDLRQVVRFIAYRFQESRIYAIGWSLGANILIRYIGQEGENCILDAAVSLCNPFDLVAADEDFHKGFNNIYDKSLAKSLRRIFRKHASLFEDIGGDYNIPLAANAKTVRDFDEGLTRVSFGYKSVDEYYADSSSFKSIPDVKIPLFCIQAANDPLAPSRGIPRAAIKANRNCLLVVTPKGGHLGWVAGENAPFGNPWTDPVIIEYLEAVDALYKDRKSTQKQKRDEDHTEIVCTG